MPLVPFSKRYPDEFLASQEDNFDAFLDVLRLFYKETRGDIKGDSFSRRKLNERFNYNKELRNIRLNSKGFSDKEIALEFNDMLKGCIRHQDPKTAFNIISSPLLTSVAGATLASLYNPNVCWDFISGKLCLYEKKIVRLLGSLVEWSHADGFVVTGGKQALAYAIRNGIGRASVNTIPGKMDDYVVICSVLAHYSIEHVCQYLGISSENCLRIPANSSGEINIKALKKALKRAVSHGKKIATVIAVGGGTINLVPDPIELIKKVIDQVTSDCYLEYVPYLHVDSVITWPWLAFGNNPTCSLDSQNLEVSKKIQAVASQLSGIKYADSFAADFHKTGFCPYSAGVFIVKETQNLLGMTPDEYIPPEDPCFGEMEPFRQTFENSRSGLPIVSIWIALRKMGLEGLREFVAYQLEVCELFKKKIREHYSDHFEVLNDHSLGWEIVFKPHFRSRFSWDELQNAPDREQQEYNDDCYAFLKHFWYSPLKKGNSQHPIIGFIRKYSRKGVHERSFPAFLIHPTSLHYDENSIDEMLKKLFEAKKIFDLNHQGVSLSSTDEYLSKMTPPR